MTAVAVAVGVGIAGASGLAVWAGTSADSGGDDRFGGMPGMSRGTNAMPRGMQGVPGTMRGEATDALHSESVIEVDGGYETQLTQKGSVISLTADSVTVRSADGYTETYTIDADRAVTSGSRHAGDAGQLTEGAIVTVTATREGDTAVATTIEDGR